MHLCFCCYQYAHYDPKKKYPRVCPHCNSSDFSFVDELILPTIIVLNKKGYKTLLSSSGHMYGEDQGPYIIFKDCHDFRIPTGFHMINHQGNTRISRLFNGFISLQVLLKEIVRLNLNLSEWAISLPNKEEKS